MRTLSQIAMLLAGLTALLSPLAPGAIQRAAAATLSLAGPPSLPTGMLSTIEVRLNGATDAAGYEFELHYDPADVAIVAPAIYPLLGGGAGCDPGSTRCSFDLGPLEQSGRLNLGAYTYGAAPGYTGDGLLASVMVQPLVTSGTITLTLASAAIVNTVGAVETPADAATPFPVMEATAVTLRDAGVSSLPQAISVGSAVAALALLTLLYFNRRGRRRFRAGHRLVNLVLVAALLAPLLFPGQILANVAQSPPATAENQGGAPLSAPGLSPPLNPDLDGSGEVDIVDVQRIANRFGETPASPGWDPALDFNGDNIIDQADVDRIADRWQSRGTHIVVTSPAIGEADVAVTRESYLVFSAPVDPATITPAALHATYSGQTLGARLHISPDNTRVTLFYDEPLPASARIRLHVDGALIGDAEGYVIDGDGSGGPGGLGNYDFDTLSLTTFPNTVVCGTVFASELAAGPGGGSVDDPLVNATISVDGMESTLVTVTDNNGDFCLAPSPAGRFFVHVDGRTATNPVPSGAYYPFVGKTWTSQISQTINIGNVYLPLIAPDTLQPTSTVSDTVITFAPSVLADHPELTGVNITVPADSLFANDGARGGMVGISPVPPERLPGPLPPDLEFPIVITVQTSGPTNFDVPAPACFPNMANPNTGQMLDPGEQTSIWSFNHDSGQWEPSAAATVTPDGSLVCSDPGEGIRAPGWHGVDPSSLLRAKMCESLGWGDAWDLFDAGLDCAKGLFGVAGDLYDLGKSLWGLGTAALGLGQGLADDYSAGDIDLADVQNGMAVYGAAKDTFGNAAKLIARNNPVGKALDLADCAKGIGGVAADKLCQTLRCHSGILDGLCSAMDAFNDPINTLIDAIKDFDATIDGLPDRVDQFDQDFDDLDQLIDDYVNDPNRPADPIPDVVSGLNDVNDQLEGMTGDIDTATEALGDARDAFGDALDNVTDLLRRLLGKAGAFRGARYHLFIAGLHFRGYFYQTLQWRVPPLRAYTLEIYSIEHDAKLIASGTSARSGRIEEIEEFTLIHPVSGESGSPAPDADIDGIPDSAEAIVGTSPANPDTDGDGVLDGGELQNGTDPLDGFLPGPGVIATVNTPGTAVDVCGSGNLAAVADSGPGLAIVAINDFLNPVVISQVDTPGSARAVACADGRAVVADGTWGIAIIGLNSGADATLERQVYFGFAANAVAVDGDTAVVGLSNGEVAVVDLDTGTILQRLPVAGGAINDIVVGGDHAYAVTNTDVYALSLNAPLSVTGSVASPFPIGALPNRRLFAGTDVLYAVHGRGYNTFSLANPAVPALIAAGSTGLFGWRDLALNGSGLGVAATGPNSGLDTSSNAYLYDTSDPTLTNQFLTNFTTPGRARAIAIYNGLAYVADHDRGIQIINYSQFDPFAVPPSVNLDASFNLGTPLQAPRMANGSIVEGQPGRLTADVMDDVQVRHVDFFVDGELAARDGSFPFEYRFNAPLRSDSVTTMTVQALAVDTGGSQTAGTVYTIDLITDTIRPLITAVAPPTGSINFDVSQVRFTVDEPLSVGTINTTTFKLTEAGADMTLHTPDDVPVTNGRYAFDDINLAGLMNFAAPLPAGLYYAEVMTDTLTDRVGNPLQAPASWQFTNCRTGTPYPGCSDASADLSVMLSDSPATVVGGNPLTLLAAVTNNGPDAAAGTTLTVTLDATYEFVSATPDQGTCSESGGVVVCDLIGVDVLETLNTTIVVLPRWNGTRTAQATVSGLVADPVPGNNSDSENTTVNPTVIAGTTLITNTIWTLVGSPYRLDGDIIVSAGVTLTIEPGVIVRAQDNVELDVRGHLEAAGTPQRNILFTSNANSGPTQWAGLLFDGGSGNIDHAEIRYSGDANREGVRAAVRAINVLTGTLRIANSHIHDSRMTSNFPDFGLNLIDSHVVVTNTTIANIGNDSLDFPLRFSGAGMEITLAGNTFSGNSRAVARIDNAEPAVGYTLPKQDGLRGYLFNGNFTVASGITLTIGAGNYVKVSDNSEIRVDGYLAAVGTPTMPITFTSDSETGSDRWSGLVFAGGLGELRHVTLEYANETNSLGHNASIDADSIVSGTLVIADSTIRNATFGINFPDRGLRVFDSQVDITGTLFTNIGNEGQDYPITLNGTQTLVTMSGNTFTGNSRSVILIGTTAPDVGYHLPKQNGLAGYLFNGNFTVAPGITLTVDPGNKVKFAASSELNVQGFLTAIGTPAMPITFTNDSESGSNRWSGLVFQGGSGEIRHATIQFAGQTNSLGNNTSIRAQDVLTIPLILADSVVRNGTFGINFNDVGLEINNSRAVVTNTQFNNIGNGGYDYPIFLRGAGVDVSWSGNSFSGNSRNRILLGTSIPVIGYDLPAQSGLVGYDWNGDIIIPAGVTVTVQAGNQMRSPGNGEVRVLGHLAANGAPGQEILFTNFGDSTSSRWSGLLFDGGSGDLNHAIVRYAGTSNSAGIYAGITVRDNFTTEVHIANSTISNINFGTNFATRGVWIRDSNVFITNTLFTSLGNANGDDNALQVNGAASNVSVSGVTIENNNGRGLRLYDGNVNVDCSRFTNNTWASVYYGGGTITIHNSVFGASGTAINNVLGTLLDAINNYWGDPSGPTHPGNPGGTGGTISGNVSYTPFETAPPTCAP